MYFTVISIFNMRSNIIVHFTVEFQFIVCKHLSLKLITLVILVIYKLMFIFGIEIKL